MNESPIFVRDLREADLPAIARIYGFYALHGLATFEEQAPDAEEMRRRWRAVVELGLPFLAAGFAEEDGVAGFAYARAYHPRSAYRFTIEDSVYVDEKASGRGLGSALLGALLERCSAGPWREMIAVIGGSDNHASIALHRKFGFREVGVLRGVGYKFGRWVDAPILQKALKEMTARVRKT